MSKMDQFAIRILFFIAERIASDGLRQEISKLSAHWCVNQWGKEES